MTITAPSKYFQLKIDATDEQVKLIYDFHKDYYEKLGIDLIIFKCDDETQNTFYITSDDIVDHDDVLFVLSLVNSIISMILFTIPNNNISCIADMDIQYRHDLPEFENSRTENVLLLKCVHKNKFDDISDIEDTIIDKFHRMTDLIKNEFKDESKFIFLNLRTDTVAIKFIDAGINDIAETCINVLKFIRTNRGKNIETFIVPNKIL